MNTDIPLNPAAANTEADIEKPRNEADPAKATEKGEIRSNRQYVQRRIDTGLRNWVKDTMAGILTSIATVVFVLLLVQFGLANQTQELSFSIFAPYEFWQSFSGLVVEWSQWNESLLLTLGIVGSFFTAAAYVWYRRGSKVVTQAHSEPDTQSGAKKREPILKRVEENVRSMKLVSALGMLSAILFGAYLYQQYLWNVELPVPAGQVGIAFTRQIGSTTAQDALADNLRKMGHESQIVMRTLPVTFDARDVSKAQEFARRIHAKAVVIYREESAPTAGGPADRMSGVSAPAPAQPQPSASRYVAYLAFADPGLGLEIPVAQKSAAGLPETVELRAKEGVDVPRLETDDLTILMEAAAGILMYDRDRYPAAISHLKNAVSVGKDTPSDALVQFYLGNSYYLIEQDAQAAQAFDAAIHAGEAEEHPGVQSRLLLAQAYIYRANIYFNERRLDEAEKLLKKAIALREPLDKDESALADPATFRWLHETAGTAYLRLLDIALYRNDTEATDLWAGRVRTEAGALAAKKADPRAQASAIRLLYRVGECAEAYKMAQEMLGSDPASVNAHRLLVNLASLRDGAWTSTEGKSHMDALVKLNPESLPDLHNLLLYYSLNALTVDPGYASKVAETAEAILAVDPNNIQALERYISVADAAVGMELLIDPSAGLFPVGDVRTFRKIQARQVEDAAQLRRVIAEKEKARPYLVRWAQEAEPDSIRPFMYAARFSSHLESYLNLYGALGDEAAKMHEDAWDRALKDATAVLESNRHPSPREQAEAHDMLSNLWRNRYLDRLVRQDNKGAGEALSGALEHSEAAVKLIEGDSSGTVDDLLLDAQIVNGYKVAAFFGTFYYDGDDARVAKYQALYTDLTQKGTGLQMQALVPYQQDNDYVAKLSCVDGKLLRDGSQALGGDKRAAGVGMLEQYTSKYPQDPAGLWSLGWGQYLSGDLDEALSTTQKFDALAPASPVAAGNRAIILLAKGDTEAAQDAVGDMLSRLDAYPVGVRARNLTDFGSDLQSLARTNKEARAGIKAVLPRVQEYVDALPVEARADKGAQLILALDNLGAASTWAGDNSSAKHFLTQALDLNGDYAPARANLALATLAGGDVQGAAAEYERAISSAAGYLLGSDGKPLDEPEHGEAVTQAHADLEQAITSAKALAAERTDLAGASAPLVKRLQQAADLYKK